MKDFNGNELAIGDTVAVIPPNYRHMLKGTIVGFTKKMIVIEYYPYNGYSSKQLATTKRDPLYVAKIVDRTA